VNGASHRRDISEARFFETLDSHTHDQSALENVSAFYALSRFPWQAPLGFSLATNGALRPQQSWSALNETETFLPPFLMPARQVTTSNSTTGSYVGDAALSASVSWGRVRDATPVYQVQVLEQRLRETGAIQGALSRGAQERLAALYTVESQVAFAHQRPTKYFWRELERLLADDGVLGAGGLDAYTVQRLLEPLVLQGSFARLRGWSVGPQVKLAKHWSHASFESASRRDVFVADTLYDSSSFSRPRTKLDGHDESIFSGASVEFHHPFGMHWQADAFASGLLSEAGEDLALSSAASAAWAIADRWQWVGNISHDATAPRIDGDRKVDQWHLNLAASLNYFFEDAWAFQLGYQHQQNHSPFDFTRFDTYTLGVSYQFAGWLNAPAVFAPMRLTPPAR
jgi:hypothetical protein